MRYSAAGSWCAKNTVSCRSGLAAVPVNRSRARQSASESRSPCAESPTVVRITERCVDAGLVVLDELVGLGAVEAPALRRAGRGGPTPRRSRRNRRRGPSAAMIAGWRASRSRTSRAQHDTESVLTGEAVALDLRPTGFALRAAGTIIDWIVYFGAYIAIVLALFTLAGTLGRRGCRVQHPGHRRPGRLPGRRPGRRRDA